MSSVIAAIWLTLKIPFLLVVDGREITIGYEQLGQYHGGWTIPHTCSHCNEIDIIGFDLVNTDVVNLKDLKQ